MITKIEDKKVITCLEARKKYSRHYIGYVTTELNLVDPETTKVLVVYLADSYNEQYEIPVETVEGQHISLMRGMSVGGTEIGGVCFDK